MSEGWASQCDACGHTVVADTEDEAEVVASDQADDGCESCGARGAFYVFEWE